MAIIKQLVSPVAKREESYLLLKLKERDRERDLRAIEKYNKSYKKIN